MTLAQRWHDIRTGFERPFWVANISELFERLSYYAAFASLARYLHETLQFPLEQATSLTGFFGGLVWFLAVFGGTLADRMGFRRALAIAYLILSIAYFLLGSLGATWMEPIRQSLPLVVIATFVLALPALGIALVKPSVVGTTARASKESVRSIGYSIYYTLVNIGGFLGPLVASYVHQHMRVESVFRVAALSVFLMFIGVLLFFTEPKKHDEAETASLAQAGKNFLTVLSNPRFMLFLAIFTGYWIVYWQIFITLPLYVSKYISPTADTELMLATGPLLVILFTVAVNLLTQRIAPLTAIIMGTLFTSVAWIVLIVRPTVTGPCSPWSWSPSARSRNRRVTTNTFRASRLGTAGHVHGLRVPAARCGLADRRPLRRLPDAQLRRSKTPAGDDVVGHYRRGITDNGAALGV